MISIGKIGFQQIMIVYSLTTEMNPLEVEVTIPEVFPDKEISTMESTRITKGDTKIYKNATIPALSNYYVSKNYIRLPVIQNFAGNSNIIGPAMSIVGSTLKIESSQETNFPINVGIGQVNMGDKLLAVFIDNSPDKGFIIGRC